MKLLIVIKYASTELKNEVLSLLENESLQINKEMKQGGRMPGILLETLKNIPSLPLQLLVDIHEEIFLTELCGREGAPLNIQDIRTILWVFWSIRKEPEIELHLKGFRDGLEAAESIKKEEREEIKKIITKEYLEQ